MQSWSYYFITFFSKKVVRLIAWSFYSALLNLYDNAGATEADISLQSRLQV